MKEVKVGQYYEFPKTTILIEKIDSNYYWYRNITLGFTSRVSMPVFENLLLHKEVMYSPKNTKLWKVINE